MQRGGRVLKFTESDFTMKSWIIQEDLTRDFQKPEDVHYTPQDVCNGSKRECTEQEKPKSGNSFDLLSYTFDNHYIIIQSRMKQQFL